MALIPHVIDTWWYFLWSPPSDSYIRDHWSFCSLLYPRILFGLTDIDSWFPGIQSHAYPYRELWFCLGWKYTQVKCLNSLSLAAKHSDVTQFWPMSMSKLKFSWEKETDAPSLLLSILLALNVNIKTGATEAILGPWGNQHKIEK